MTAPEASRSEIRAPSPDVDRAPVAASVAATGQRTDWGIGPDGSRVRMRPREPELAATTRALQQLARDPAFAAGSGVLVDLACLEKLPGRLEVEALVLGVAALRQRYRGGIALVATRPALFGRVRRAALFAAAHGLPLEAFRTVERAERWLDGAANG